MPHDHADPGAGPPYPLTPSSSKPAQKDGCQSYTTQKVPGTWPADLRTPFHALINGGRKQSSKLTQRLGIEGISPAREKAHCSSKEFPEKHISATSFGNLVHVLQLSTRSYGAANKHLGKGLCVALFCRWEPFNPACVLNQQALPYWVGKQCSFKTLQTEDRGSRGIPGVFLSSVWSQGQSLGPRRQSPACNWVWWLVPYSFRSWLECLCQPWGCGGLWNPWFPEAHHFLLPTQFNYSHSRSVSKCNQASYRVRLSTLLGIWETMKNKRLKKKKKFLALLEVTFY